MEKLMKNKVASTMLVLAMFIAGCSVEVGDPLTGSVDSQPGATNTQAALGEGAGPDREPVATDLDYVIVDTGQIHCYDDDNGILCPEAGEAFAGQDAQYEGKQPSYVDNGDGTLTDLNTGLMWQQDPGGKISYDQAVAGASSFRLAGYDDWRLPTIKELYSLILFSGDDPSGCDSENSCPGLNAFIDTDFFAFEYGDTSAGERLIDAQFISSTEYVANTVEGQTVFGVNFADGRIKGYGTGAMPGQSQDKGFFVLYVRGNSEYGENDFADNGDGSISDLATGLTWTQDDSGMGMIWEDALAYCENIDAAGYGDWRLPDAKQLQSLVDYSRSPDTTNSAAIDALFNSTTITNEGGEMDYGFYWSSTTHVNWRAGGSSAAYVGFGRSLGYMRNRWVDVHGAGSQRSDPKTGDPADYPTGHGPQGDAIRIYNYVRCVHGSATGEMNTGGEIDPGSGIAAIPSGGDGQPAGPQGGQPPQEAIAACTGQSEGATCSFQSPRGQINGTCISVQEQLACVPKGGPPPGGGGS